YSCTRLKPGEIEMEDFLYARSAGVSLLQNWSPGLVRVKAIDSFCNFKCVGTEVLLIDHSVLAYHECFDASYAVLCGSGDERESPDHCAVDEVIKLAQWRSRTLSFQYLEVVTMVGFGLRRVPTIDSLSYVLTNWTTP